MSRIECPTCGVSRGEPRWPSARTTPWSDDCACSDAGTCIYHQTHTDELPKRPDQETLEERAGKAHAWQSHQFAEMYRKFRQAAHAWEEITRLKAEIDMLRGVGCMEAKEGEDVSGPCGVCRKCAFRRGAEAMREAAAQALSTQGNGYYGLTGSGVAKTIRALPIPEDKS